MIQVETKKTWRGIIHNCSRENQIPHGRAVTFEFTADDLDSNNDGEEDEYTAARILSDEADSSTPG